MTGRFWVVSSDKGLTAGGCFKVAGARLEDMGIAGPLWRFGVMEAS